MGICMSTVSSQIHETEEVISSTNEEIVFPENDLLCGIQKLDSICTKQGNKGLNQDAAFFYQNYGAEHTASLLAVFDGHGKNGHTVSNIAKNRIPTLLLGKKTTGESSENLVSWEEAIVNTFKVMDKEIKLQENLDCTFSGSTAVLAWIKGEDLVVANLGDSRALLGRMSEDGIKAIQLTTDLKPSLPNEEERIRRCNGRVLALKEEAHIQRVWLPNEDAPGLAMSRTFGDFALKNHGIISLPEVSHRRLTSDDRFIVLATDGVWDVLSNNQVASIVWAAENEEAAAKAVVEAAVVAWKRYPSSKQDDCTVVCLFLQSHPNSQT